MGGDRRWKDGETPNLWYRIAEQVWGGGEGADEIGDGEATRRGGDGSGSQGEEKQHLISWTPYNLFIGAWLCWRTAWMVPWTKVTWFLATLFYFLVLFLCHKKWISGPADFAALPLPLLLNPQLLGYLCNVHVPVEFPSSLTTSNSICLLPWWNYFSLYSYVDCTLRGYIISFIGC